MILRRAFSPSVLCVLVFAAGCSQPLHTLMDLGAEQDALKARVASRSVLFDELLRDVRKQALQPGVSRRALIERYGEPVLERGSVLLYRYPVAFFEGPKVYLELNAEGRLENVRIVERSGT
ncbi:MAG: hypothetical protein ACM3L6_05910 [Deltaproteobacteria bacterium]